jgi:hypothetical protein
MQYSQAKVHRYKAVRPLQKVWPRVRVCSAPPLRMGDPAYDMDLLRMIARLRAPASIKIGARALACVFIIDSNEKTKRRGGWWFSVFL